MAKKRLLFQGTATLKDGKQHSIYVYHLKNLDYEIKVSGRPPTNFTSPHTVEANTFKNPIELHYSASNIELKFVAS